MKNYRFGYPTTQMKDSFGVLRSSTLWHVSFQVSTWTFVLGVQTQDLGSENHETTRIHSENGETEVTVVNILLPQLIVFKTERKIETVRHWDTKMNMSPSTVTT